MNDRTQAFNRDCVEAMKEFPDKFFELAIVDPPYNIKIDDWDNIKEYESFIRSVVKELDRITKRTATMYFFGDFTWIATCKLIIDEFDFGLRSWLIWDKGAKQQNSTRTFANITEHCLHYTKPKFEFASNPVANYLNKKRVEAGLSLADINRVLGFATNGGGVASSYMGDKDSVTIPSENHYNLLKPILNLDLEREELLQLDCRYTFNTDDIRVKRNPKDSRTYSNDKQIPTNIFYNQNGFEGGLIDHPTPKPLNLIKTLILASSNPGDKVISPFLGSGTDRIACYDEGRTFYGYELDKDYYDAAEKRFQQHKSQLKLFPV